MTFYYIPGDRSNAWVHVHHKKRWFHINPESPKKGWGRGKIEPVGQRIDAKEVKEMRLPKHPI